MLLTDNIIMTALAVWYQQFKITTQGPPFLTLFLPVSPSLSAYSFLSGLFVILSVGKKRFKLKWHILRSVSNLLFHVGNCLQLEMAFLFENEQSSIQCIPKIKVGKRRPINLTNKSDLWQTDNHFSNSHENIMKERRALSADFSNQPSFYLWSQSDAVKDKKSQK